MSGCACGSNSTDTVGRKVLHLLKLARLLGKISVVSSFPVRKLDFIFRVVPAVLTVEDFAPLVKVSRVTFVLEALVNLPWSVLKQVGGNFSVLFLNSQP